MEKKIEKYGIGAFQINNKTITRTIWKHSNKKFIIVKGRKHYLKDRKYFGKYLLKYFWRYKI
jgi:hypothetical protein